jgi:hypothetical protein
VGCIIKIIPGFDQKCGIAFHFVMIPKKGRGFQLGFEGYLWFLKCYSMDKLGSALHVFRNHVASDLRGWNVVPAFAKWSADGVRLVQSLVRCSCRWAQSSSSKYPIFRSGSLLSVGRAKWHLERSTLDLRCKILHNVNPRWMATSAFYACEWRVRPR